MAKFNEKSFNATSPLTVSDMDNLVAGIVQAAPVGSFTWFCGKTVPEGWLICNGQGIASDSRYEKLRSVLGSNYVPNLTGQNRFIRASTENGSDVLVIQSDGIKTHNLPNHNHATGIYVSANDSHHNVSQRGGVITSGAVVDQVGNYGATVYNMNTSTASLSYSGESETRPVNIKMLPIIKY